MSTDDELSSADRLVRDMARLVDLDLSDERARVDRAHLESLLPAANELSRFVDSRPHLPLYRAPQ
ncbi:hypothetical protein ACFY2R_25530 [Micromonospora olivasterospora]|uniref:Uncharacterized protein n=1 Tax=Micromonospora olivasterospora TaxID=1880 RepID=A0A562I3C9_MICOL|nr:hypothetical protein [Micromonospora olivasterospora]TWH65204.1 hypothetical protein JD77_00139 [Micromonospora olivasterospora]